MEWSPLTDHIIEGIDGPGSLLINTFTTSDEQLFSPCARTYYPNIRVDTVEFLFAPDLIILGGGISRPNKKEQYLKYLSTKAELVTAILQNEAGIIGAAYMARDLALPQPAAT